MSTNSQTSFHLAAALSWFALLVLTGCQPAATNSSPPPPPTVIVAKPVQKQIVEWDAYTGRLEPIKFVEIRARVGGYLQSVHFDEGQLVNQGDLLFIIDPRPFEAELKKAEANLHQAESMVGQAKSQLNVAIAEHAQYEAQLKLAKGRIDRARTLFADNAVSQEEVDQREAVHLTALANIEANNARITSSKSAIATANAAIETAKAEIELAELNLTYTKIHAPITGRISREMVNRGNLVNGGTATSTLLTTIAAVKPIYCTFDANEQAVLKYIRLALSGKRKSSRSAKNPVFLKLVDESKFDHTGHMDFVDNRFDAGTARMRARCIFPNEDQVLLPGMFARIRIPGSAAYKAVLIPDSAIGTDQSSQFVYVVNEGVVERRSLVLGPIVDGLRVVREGLSGDEDLVIEGLLKARPEMAVNTKPGEIIVAEDGLPDNYQPLSPEDWISPAPDPLPESAATTAQTNVESEGGIAQ